MRNNERSIHSNLKVGYKIIKTIKKGKHELVYLEMYSVPLFVQTRYTEQGERIWQSSNDGRRSASLR